MGSTSREIKSPTATATAATVSVGDNQSLLRTANGRKKLEAHFLESDDRRGGALMARAYAAGLPGGTTPVDIRGRPLSDDRLRNTGGWLPTFFIFGNEMAERLAYFGLSVNMVIFMFYVMHRPFSSSANAVNIFLGISQASSVVGGFIADAYLGRYWTIAIFSTIYLAGLTGITLGATMSVFMPNQQDCDQIALLLGSCEAAKPWQMSYLYAVLYLTGFGAAGIRPCVSSFGADQFDETSKDYKSHLERFFNAFYLAVTLGAIMAFTAVVYIQMEHGWGSAFGSLAIAMAVSNLLFFLGTPTYRHRLTGGSPMTRVAQVLAAAIHKRKAHFSSSEMVGLYELPGKGRSSRIPHTEGFRWLDKAALLLKEDCANPSPWRLCTVTQVEEVKILIRMIPVSACTIMLSLILTEFLTLSVQQAYTLNTHIGRLKVPVTCMPVFPCVSIFLMLSLYYSVFVPLSRRLTGHPHGVSQLQRMGIGLALSVFSVAWAGVFERFRRNYAIKHSYEAIFLTPMQDLSAYWLLIQYCLIGIAEVFCIVGLLEFLYEEAPDAMRSIGSAYAAVAGGLGCFAASLLNSIVKSMTRTETGGTEESWLSQNINKGKFDYLYWLLTVVSLINFFGFLYAARKYKYRRTDR